SSSTKTKKTTDCKTCEKPASQVEQIFQEELEKLKRQENEANDALRKDATHDSPDANTNSTNILNAVSAPVGAVGPFGALNDAEPSYPDDPSMPHIEDIFASPSEGIFTNLSYDDEGVVTDFNNLDTTMTVSPTPTTRIHTIHPKTQILGDPTIEAIRNFLAFASYIGFVVYQMDVKSVFLYGIIDEEVYVIQPPGFIDHKFPNKKSRCDEFEELMKKSFQMSSMGKLTFFLRLQVKEKEDGIFISHNKYVLEILKKFDFVSVKTASTPIGTQ
nr:hypothetical protein [Tanacetum cinerariifolium]